MSMLRYCLNNNICLINTKKKLTVKKNCIAHTRTFCYILRPWCDNVLFIKFKTHPCITFANKLRNVSTIMSNKEILTRTSRPVIIALVGHDNLIVLVTATLSAILTLHTMFQHGSRAKCRAFFNNQRYVRDGMSIKNLNEAKKLQEQSCDGILWFFLYFFAHNTSAL